MRSPEIVNHSPKSGRATVEEGLHVTLSCTAIGNPRGVIHKPRGQLRGREVSQMTILLHKSYLVKVTTKGRGSGRNSQKFDHVVYG